MTLAARPTTYRGIEMRSRLEATVAAHLDDWGYDWKYEPRAFADRHGQYLPDFVIYINGKFKLVLEVKGEMVMDDDPFQRMRAVWSSEPQAWLAIVEAETIKDGYWAIEGFPRSMFLLKLPDLDAHCGGIFGLCRCGTVGIRFVVPIGNRKFTVSGFCRSCRSEEPVLAYLDPTEYRG